MDFWSIALLTILVASGVLTVYLLRSARAISQGMVSRTTIDTFVRGLAGDVKWKLCRYVWSRALRIPLQGYWRDTFGGDNVEVEVAYTHHGSDRCLGEAHNTPYDSETAINTFLEHTPWQVIQDGIGYVTPRKTPYRSETKRSSSLYEALAKLEASYGCFNFSSVTPQRVLQICNDNRLEYRYVPRQTLQGFSSVLAVYKIGKQDDGSETRGIILVDDSLPLYRKGFLILHELGHWFVDACNRSGSSLPMPFENASDFDEAEEDALLFALIASYPTPELHWAHHYDDRFTGDRKSRAQVQAWLEQYLAEYAEHSYGGKPTDQLSGFGLNVQAMQPALRTAFFANIRKRVDFYLEYEWQVWGPHSATMGGPVLSEDLTHLKRLYSGYPWAELDTKDEIVDSNEHFARLTGHGGSIPNGTAISSVVHPASHYRLRHQLSLRKKGEIGCYCIQYMISNSQEGRVAWVEAWPVAHAKDDSRKPIGPFGSFAILLPRRGPGTPSAYADLNTSAR